MKNKVFKFVLPILLLLSIAINCICVLPYLGSYLDRIEKKIKPEVYFSKEVPDSVVIESVLERSLELEGLTFSCEEPKRGLWYDIRTYFAHPESGVFNNYSLAYLYAGLSEYAVSSKDTLIVKELENKVSSFTHGDELTYKLLEVDQVPIGICYLNLYKMTNDSRYLRCANRIYEWLLTLRSENSNIIYYRKGANQFIDALGMYIPFLVRYSEVTNNTLAKRVAYDNMNEYYKYGVDKETGIPMHGYNIENKVKVGSSNWGRGIGWYVLAASFLPEFQDEQLDSHLPLLKTSQFPNTSSSFDSSTALMFEIYLQKRGIHSRSLDFIKPYITDEGIIMNCSGDTYDFNNHSYIFGPAELSQGLFLFLVANR